MFRAIRVGAFNSRCFCRYISDLIIAFLSRGLLSAREYENTRNANARHVDVSPGDARKRDSWIYPGTGNYISLRFRMHRHTREMCVSLFLSPVIADIYSFWNYASRFRGTNNFYKIRNARRSIASQTRNFSSRMRSSSVGCAIFLSFPLGQVPFLFFIFSDVTYRVARAESKVPRIPRSVKSERTNEPNEETGRILPTEKSRAASAPPRRVP